MSHLVTLRQESSILLLAVRHVWFAIEESSIEEGYNMVGEGLISCRDNVSHA